MGTKNILSQVLEFPEQSCKQKPPLKSSLGVDRLPGKEQVANISGLVGHLVPYPDYFTAISL